MGRRRFFFRKWCFLGEFAPEVSAQRVADVLRTNAPQGAQIDNVLGLINRNLRISSPASQHSSASDRLKCINPDNSDAFLHFLVIALRFAVCPWRRRHRSGAFCVATRSAGLGRGSLSS